MKKLLNSELYRLSNEEFKESRKLPVVLVLDNVRSHLNVGSVFRTADAFRLESVYLCGITGVPPHRDIHKTALGATETVAWKYFSNIMDALAELKVASYILAAVEQAERSVLLSEFSPVHAQRYAFIFGNEVDGVQQQAVDASDVCIEIPQWGTKHSLNVAVTAGIVAWEAARQWHLNNLSDNAFLK